eukprot:CAMPEP_0172392960 /NCGR_PEP_ID=MMETSP1061-20121228/8941_1 /TAXON_ID=37318 /ORGANISM="Pseudo-nitzschia pungens, Strain cf. pungens" /LENGTH=326 /DNA_ID=CAMNT_0013123903 /DNA_START=246 /DNA_END=1226 /DNA_ORIENTATION=-
MVRPNRSPSLWIFLAAAAAGTAPSLSFQLQPIQIGLHCNHNHNHNRNHKLENTESSTQLCAAGKGFGKSNPSSNSKKAPTKSYGRKEIEPIRDLIDEESGMREFFESNEPWQPLFRSMTPDASVPATSFLNGPDNNNNSNNNNSENNDNNNNDKPFEFSETTSPWKKLNPIPTDADDIAVLGRFLDAMQTSLIEDIPVDETTKDDDNDLHFIEEGRRMLVCSRYHVVQGIEKGSVETFDRLFAICWSELVELRTVDEADTGSLIVTPGFDYDDLRRFVDMNLQRPLQWLGVDGFEVASLEKGGLGVIRILHKLSDIPTELPERPPE